MVRIPLSTVRPWKIIEIETRSYADQLKEWAVQDLERIRKENLASRGFPEPYDFEIDEEYYFRKSVPCVFCQQDTLSNNEEHIFMLRLYKNLLENNSFECHETCFIKNVSYDLSRRQTNKAIFNQCDTCNCALKMFEEEHHYYAISRHKIVNHDRGIFAMVAVFQYCPECWESMAGPSFFER